MWLAPLVITSVCNFNVRQFPYDTQSCEFTLGSWSYDGHDVDLWNNTPTGTFKLGRFPEFDRIVTLDIKPLWSRFYNIPRPEVKESLILFDRQEHTMTYVYCIYIYGCDPYAMDKTL